MACQGLFCRLFAFNLKDGGSGLQPSRAGLFRFGATRIATRRRGRGWRDPAETLEATNGFYGAATRPPEGRALAQRPGTPLPRSAEWTAREVTPVVGSGYLGVEHTGDSTHPSLTLGWLPAPLALHEALHLGIRFDGVRAGDSRRNRQGIDRGNTSVPRMPSEVDRDCGSTSTIKCRGGGRRTTTAKRVALAVPASCARSSSTLRLARTPARCGPTRQCSPRGLGPSSPCSTGSIPASPIPARAPSRASRRELCRLQPFLAACNSYRWSSGYSRVPRRYVIRNGTSRAFRQTPAQAVLAGQEPLRHDTRWHSGGESPAQNRNVYCSFVANLESCCRKS